MLDIKLFVCNLQFLTCNLQKFIYNLSQCRSPWIYPFRDSVAPWIYRFAFSSNLIYYQSLFPWIFFKSPFVPLSFWNFDYTNVQSWVIVSQIPKALLLLSFCSDWTNSINLSSSSLILSSYHIQFIIEYIQQVFKKIYCIFSF